jgi:ABC-type molybdate transport system substrate-binding protein
MIASPQHKVRLYAAGSLRAALTNIGKLFAAEAGHEVEAKFGPSGLLKDAIASGSDADLFASANMEYPRALNRSNRTGPVFRFARNSLCALVRPGSDVDSVNLVERMLDPTIKLGTSTPNSDPSGDYAFAVFRKLEALKPGAGAILEKKALKLTGSADSAAPPAGRLAYGWHIAEGRADIFVVYRTAAAEAQQQYPGQQIVELPPGLAVGAEYGLTIIAGAAPAAQRFADFILSSTGQDVLIGHGFKSGTTER